MTQAQPTEAREGRIDRYNAQEIEGRWQERWQRDRLYEAREDPGKAKFYCLDFFPYPSGDSLSVGHARNYIPTDAVSRFYRMRGYGVLHPMGWDAFGLPAEQAALTRGLHPKQIVP